MLLHRTLRTLALTLATASVFALPTSAHAEITRETLSNAKPSNLVNINPVRIEQDVTPGSTSTETISIYNDSDQVATFKTNVVDMGPPEDEALLGQPFDFGQYEFGAGSWITSELQEATLQPFQKIEFDLIITPPDDAPVGSSYAGLNIEVKSSKPTEEDTQVAIKMSSMIQILLTVPGEVQHDLKLLDAKTRDSFRMGNTSFVSYGVRYRNDGTIQEHVKGKIVITSIFGNKVKTIDLGERVLIRGATGTDRATWTDLPMFGIFDAEVQIEGDDGKVVSKDAGRIVLLPPWWLIALIVLALVVPPTFIWWRRRQEWQQYLAEEDWADAEDEDGEFA